MRVRRLVLLAAALAACGDPSAALDAATDAGPADAGAATDAAPDAAIQDAGQPAIDAGAIDAGPPAPVTAARIGEFTLRVTEEGVTARRGDRPVLTQAWGLPLAEVAQAELHVEERRGSFEVEERVRPWCRMRAPEGFVETSSAAAVLAAPMTGEGACGGTLRVRFTAPRPGHLGIEVRADGFPAEVVRLNLSSAASARVFGFGEQFTHLNLKGRAVPILSQEGGIGRGRSPITEGANLISPGSGGGPFTTYAAMGHFVQDDLRSLALENTEYAVFDFAERADAVRVRVFADRLVARAYVGASMLELIERHTEWAGRMPEPPAWLDRGAIVGMQGGTARVRTVWAELQARGAPISAFWLQDWVGKRPTSIGSQLWWSWTLDEGQYPGWDQLVADFAAADIRTLGYINPFLVDVAERGSRDLYQEAIDRGFVVQRRRSDGTLEPYDLTVTDFPTVLVDLSNPDAQDWLQQVIRDEMLQVGLSGWMADFAEALPFDAILSSGEPAAAYHNRYPVEWAALNRAAIEDAGRAGDALFFTRAGHTRSPGESTAFWLGDQMVTWDADDGFQSAMIGLLAGGFSGLSINHADIGGYTSISFSLAGQDFGFVRERRLLERWTEVSAFTALFRTHEGNQPEANAQFYDDAGSYDHFTRFATVYRALAPYRRALFREAATRGWPVVRHPLLHFPTDEVLGDLEGDAFCFLLGDQFLVAPVVDKAVTARRLYLPPGHWVHLWTGFRYGSMQRGTWHTIGAPVGQPPVFYPAGSPVGAALEAALQTAGILTD